MPAPFAITIRNIRTQIAVRWGQFKPSQPPRCVGRWGQIRPSQRHLAAAHGGADRAVTPGPTQAVRASCADTGRTTGTATPQVVPAGRLFLLGDNLAESEDSRMFGWAPTALVDGVVMWRVYPVGSFGSVGDGVTLGSAAAR